MFVELLYIQDDASYTGETLGAVDTTRALGATALGSHTTTDTYVASSIGATTTTDAWIGN